VRKSEENMELLLKNCRFIRELTEGYEQEYGDLLVADGRIREIGAHLEQEGARIVDLNGQTLMPGIIDLHVHLADMGRTRRSPGASIFYTYQYARYLMSIGVTTVRDCGNDLYLPAGCVRDAVREGIVRGPRILSSGMTLSPTECGNEYYREFIRELDGPYEMRKAARETMQQGADFIKFLGSGSLMGPGSNPGRRVFEDDELKEVVNIARLFNSHVAIHAHGADAIFHAVQCGARTIEHASFIDQRSIDLLRGRQDQGVVPTIAVLYEAAQRPQSDPAFAYVQAKAQGILEQVRECLQSAYLQGVLMGWGTDFELALYREDPGIEFRLRKEFLHFRDADIVKQATINSAVLAGLDREIGSVKVGKVADLIAVDGRPEEDVRCLYAGARRVICRGEPVDGTFPA
jgi:imidazolonepropionase-like amidohydrolase